MNEHISVMLPVDASGLGELQVARLEGAGIYYIEVNAASGVESYYLVMPDAKISPAARKYGTPFVDGTRLYQRGKRNGFDIIRFEAARSNLKYMGPNYLEGDIGSFAQRAALEYPDYFGEVPAPLETPFGNMVRYWRLDAGIFWVETDDMDECLAVAPSIWNSELSGAAIDIARQTVDARNRGLVNPSGFLFYRRELCCIPFFELMKTHKSIADKVDQTELLEILEKNCPQYLKWHEEGEKAYRKCFGSELRCKVAYDFVHSYRTEGMPFVAPDLGTEYYLPY